MKGMEEFGQHLKLDEVALAELWEAISDGKPALSKDDFKLSDVRETVLEFTGKNAALMSTFAEIMDVVLKEE